MSPHGHTQRKAQEGACPQPLPKPIGSTAPVVREYRELSPDGQPLAITPEGRQWLKYLVSCALPQGQGAFALVSGQRYDFPGSLGLAPQWLDRPMTLPEQRWVSAAMLARTNFFGLHVVISMQNPASGFASLHVSKDETREFTICEGDFFGNIFAEPPVACVALGRRSAAQQADPVLNLRVGTQVDPHHPKVDGHQTSRCGFLITGFVDEPSAHHHQGIHYHEFIRVYLKPQTEAPPLAPDSA